MRDFIWTPAGRTRGRPGVVPRTAAAIILAVVAAGCGGDSSGPVIDIQKVAGTYGLATLTFDPQGSLPESDIRAKLNTSVQMILAGGAGALQIVYQNPITNLFTTISGTYRTTSTGARLEFAANSGYPSLLLSRTMDFAFDSIAGTLSFSGSSPDGVSRQRLVQLVPELANEQLLDPVPGSLTVTFVK